jgi:hypothetical protein
VGEGSTEIFDFALVCFLSECLAQAFNLGGHLHELIAEAFEKRAHLRCVNLKTHRRYLESGTRLREDLRDPLGELGHGTLKLTGLD